MRLYRQLLNNVKRNNIRKDLKEICQTFCIIAKSNKLIIYYNFVQFFE